MVVNVPISVSDEELERIGEANPGWRVEVVDGVIVLSPANSEAGRRNANLTALLWTWAKLHGYVAFDSSTGFRVSPSDMLSPDLALVRRARWEALTENERNSFAPLVPDVVVELVSSSDDAAGMHVKAERWQALGAACVVLLDPFAKQHVHVLGTPPAEFPVDWSEVLA